ncbi:MAG: MaoC/PaaZ C-terminal domain-containing protein [Candidatus Hodarchaeales archaeon]
MKTGILDPNIVGKRYEGPTEIVNPEKIKEYARATNETNPIYYKSDENKLAVPPLFPIIMLTQPMIDVVTDDTLNLDISHMVHCDQEIFYHRPLKPRDQINIELYLNSIDVKNSGDILWVHIRGIEATKLVFKMRAGLFFRKQRKNIKKVKINHVDSVKHEIIVSRRMKVTSDQSERYSATSGDTNPIHLDKEYAISVGLPDRILHGMCTMAFAIQVFVDEIANGDPTKVIRVRTRFTNPVFMNETLITHGWILNETETRKIVGFETKNEEGVTVLMNGEIEIENTA